MQFVLAGFHQLGPHRQYYFDAFGKDRIRKRVAVKVDLELTRRYEILLQELPLLCRRLLDVRGESESILFTEGHMAQYAEERAATKKASLEKRARRQTISRRTGDAWRKFPLSVVREEDLSAITALKSSRIADA